MNISEIGGTLNVTDSLNVASDLNVNGNLHLTGNLRVDGVAYIPALHPATGSGDAGSGEYSTQELELMRAELLSAISSETTARQNADTSQETAIGVIRIDTAGAQNSARQAQSKAEEALTTANEAVSAAETARQRAERVGQELRRDTDWWLFPVVGGAQAVTTDGASTVTFAKEGFNLCAGGSVYHIAPSVSSSISITFSFGETGYLCLNCERLFKLLPDQKISISSILEKVLSASLVTSGKHIPIAFCRGGQAVKLYGRFADVFG